MELIKRNIHMDRVKRSTVIQFTVEEDLNLPEDKPDISTLNLEKGEVVIEVSYAGDRDQSGAFKRCTAL